MKNQINLPKSAKGELRNAERDEGREFAPQAIPRVFWADCAFFFLFGLPPSPLLLLPEEEFEGTDLKLRFDFEPELELITAAEHWKMWKNRRRMRKLKRGVFIWGGKVAVVTQKFSSLVPDFIFIFFAVKIDVN